MPNYDYYCENCKKTVEVFQSMKDAPLTKCPKCQSPKFVRQISAGAIVCSSGAANPGKSSSGHGGGCRCCH